MNCPNCEAENPDTNVFCNKCRTKLAGASASQTAPQNQPAANVDEGVKRIIVKRFDAIKNKDEAAVTGLIGDDHNKFDDWPPYQRQERPQALQNEFSALKVMSNYTHELKDLKTDMLGNTALATFTINHKTTMRNQQPEGLEDVFLKLTGAEDLRAVVEELKK